MSNVKTAQDAMRAIVDSPNKTLLRMSEDATMVQLGFEIALAQTEYIQKFMEILHADGMPHQITVESTQKWADDFALEDA